jgi:hypothetical protein
MINLIIQNKIDIIPTVNNHLFNMMSYLESLDNFYRITYDSISKMTVSETREYIISVVGQIPDNIVICDKLTDLDNVKLPPEIKVNVILDDLHHQGSKKRKRVNNLKFVHRIFSTYAYTFGKYFQTTIPVYFFPHSFAYRVEFNSNPILKLLLSGRRNSTQYPFREKMFRLNDKRIVQLAVNHNYSISKDSSDLIYGERYIKELNKYFVCFTCDANIDRPYILSKHFEILGSGALLLAGNQYTKEYFEKIGIIDGIHYIAVTMENVMQKIDYVLDPVNLEAINRIRFNGYQIANEKHFYLNRANQLISVLNGEKCRLETDGICNSKYYLIDS